MIYHLSIPARDPVLVSQALAELLGPQTSIHPFPIDPHGYFVIAGTKTVAAIEVYPCNLTLKPGITPDGIATPVNVLYQAPSQPYVSTHFAIQSPLSKDEIIRISDHYGWPSLYCTRGENFNVVEVWLEKEFLVEVIAAEDEEDAIKAHDPKIWGPNMRM